MSENPIAESFKTIYLYLDLQMYSSTHLSFMKFNSEFQVVTTGTYMGSNFDVRH